MLPRTLEPEVMDTREEAVDYDSMDHRDVNRCFVDDLLQVMSPEHPHGQVDLGHVFDAGTGTALIPIELCQQERVHCRITAVDYAVEMLALAERNIARAGLQTRITVVQADCKQLLQQDDAFDTVISNSIVHHIPQPRLVLSEMVRVLRPGGCMLVRDLMRPDDSETVDRLVDLYAGDSNDHQRKMFRDSLHAALTLREIRELLNETGLSADCVDQTSDRHWTITVCPS
jgi:ubiquinone/menaquinone biosynthesis C-methylase UbiE